MCVHGLTQIHLTADGEGERTDEARFPSESDMQNANEIPPHPPLHRMT